jgi:hypothetical protein
MMEGRGHAGKERERTFKNIRGRSEERIRTNIK